MEQPIDVNYVRFDEGIATADNGGSYTVITEFLIGSIYPTNDFNFTIESISIDWLLSLVAIKHSGGISYKNLKNYIEIGVYENTQEED